MKKIVVECLVDETRLLDVYKELCDIDDFHDALNAELGVMEENGVYAEHWYVKEDEKYTPSAENGDYSPSNPWDAPGMRMSDFI